MKPLPTDPFALHARMMNALIDDILEPGATTFGRLDAMREVLKQDNREPAQPNKRAGRNS